MTTMDFISALFCQVDDHMHGLPKHPQATLWPSEVVTLGLLHAIKGVGNRAFYRWLTKDDRALCPHLPERTRLFRLFMTHQAWTQAFLVPVSASRSRRTSSSVSRPATPNSYGTPLTDAVSDIRVAAI